MIELKQFEQVCRQLAPKRWRASVDAPSTWQALQQASEQGEIVIWSGASDCTLYSSSAANWTFRAWHDATHLARALDFSLSGEERAAEAQLEAVYRVTSDKRLRQFCQDWLEIEVVEQARIAVYQGIFVENQLAFGLQRLRDKGWAI